MILGIQIIAVVFALIMIYFAYLYYSRGEITFRENLSWWVIWVATIFIVIFPDILRGFSQKIFITRVFDFMVVGGFVVVITLSFLAYVRVKRIEKKLEDLVRREALKGVKNAKK